MLWDWTAKSSRTYNQLLSASGGFHNLKLNTKNLKLSLRRFYSQFCSIIAKSKKLIISSVSKSACGFQLGDRGVVSHASAKAARSSISTTPSPPGGAISPAKPIGKNVQNTNNANNANNV